MYVMTDAHSSLRFSAIFSASLLFTLLHSGATSPVVVKTRGLNEDFSTSITLWLYQYVQKRCFRDAGAVVLRRVAVNDLNARKT